jgi:hypothetical protein
MSEPDKARRAARAYGLQAETIATLWLRARLYKILDRNYTARSTSWRGADEPSPSWK